MEINKYIDHTILAAYATKEEIVKLCQEAKQYDFFSVCVNSCYVPLAAQELKGTSVAVCSVVGFPLGQMSKEAKVFETKEALVQGATEIDMVINVGFLKSGLVDEVRDEIKAIKDAMGEKVLKVIIETCYLTNEEKVLASQLSVEAGADFVKTSTGFGTGGATLEDIEIMKKAVNGKAKLKASGGVRDLKTAKEYIEAGVDRIGTSNGINIVQGIEAEGDSY
ncbi:deoxyribose-phosphate aldolase [Aureibacter tunicatorum]|uniref:Deoxyribose-phosphate aldolase n=1 Tax=Aureibacter tunicatorum TaxID=866807 RepID=A0AAE3XT58_9BACT|nr:deoxyribose-phosphate aldolase [Aureibacter tunicatorum]MDR6241628.1 deoxyribose-phosphate aldolase [Aureibacter tunicatorum]BDD07256.1 deoxyribose-phosphate aldolase [Aureibacter tunicatorum]